MLWRKPAKWNRPLVTALMAALVASSGLVAPVYAQDGGDESGATDEQKAETHFNKGVDAFFKKNYPQAITHFQRANVLDPDPVTLYNISLAHSKMGNAADALEKALEAEEMGGMPEDTALKNQARIVAYRRALTAARITEAINPPVATKDGGDRLKEPDVAQDNGIGAVGWAGVGTAGLGAGALIGAGVLNFIVSGNLEEYDTARADGDYGRASGLHADIGDRQQMGRVLLYSGAGLVAVGAALFAYDFLGAAEPASGDQTAVFGSVGSDGASVQLKWTF